MADKEVQLAAPAAPAGGRRKVVLLGAGAVLLFLGVGAAVLYFTGWLPGQWQAGAASSQGAKPVRREAVYVSLDPPFTVNLQGHGPTRYFQATVEVLTRDPAVEAALKRHLPIIRNDLVILFSSKDAKDLASMEGKERLRAEALATVKKVLEGETGTADVEQVFFTSFVMQ